MQVRCAHLEAVRQAVDRPDHRVPVFRFIMVKGWRNEDYQKHFLEVSTSPHYVTYA